MDDTTSGAWHQLPGWTQAHTGLRWYFRALVVLCIQLGATILLSMFVAMSPSEGAVYTMVIVSGLFSFAVQGMSVYGLSKYVAVPAETGGRGLAQAAFVLIAITFLVGTVTFVISVADLDAVMRRAGETDPVSLISGLASLVMIVLFLMSMGRVAAYIEQYDIQKLVGTTLTLLGGIIALILLMLAVVSASPGAAGFALVMMLLLLGLGIWMLVNLMMIVYRLSEAIEKDVDVSRAFD